MTHVSNVMCAIVALTLFLAAPGLALAQSQATTAEIKAESSTHREEYFPESR